MRQTSIRTAAALMAAGLLAIADDRPAAAQDVSLNPQLTPAGAGAFGVFDPSLAYDGDKAHISYSVIDPSAQWPAQNERIVQTYIARSPNQGATWTVLGGPVNRALDVTLPGGVPGTWHHEVSALIHDPGAPVAERWKLIWHHYLLRDGVRDFQNGWIAYKTAPRAEWLAFAQEIKLFAGAGYNPENNFAGGPTRSPLGGPPKIRLDLAFPQLQECAGFTEPGLTVTQDALFLTMACGRAQDSNRIFLLRCAHPCDPVRQESWTYAGTAAFPYLLTEAEAAAFGKNGFSAPELYSFAGRDLLIASPTSDSPVKDAYNGCLVFEFVDIDSGRLQRHPNGVPVAENSIFGTPGSFNGVCTVNARAYGGRYLYGEVSFPAPDKPFFSIYRSEQSLF